MEKKRADIKSINADIKIEHLHGTVQRYCLSLTKSKWDAEDLAQETWLKALRAADKGQHQHNNQEALMLRIAKNTWIDETRRRNQYARILLIENPILAESRTDTLEIEESLHAILKHLSPLQRTVFLLREGLALSISDTSELLHLSKGAVKAALYRARERLHEVRSSLEEAAAIQPLSDDRQKLLKAITTAYRNGDLNALIELAMLDEAAVVTQITRKTLVQTSSRAPYIHSMLQMAA
ncbi:RNA polymerase sigma factor [Paenibacillus luteus]|uniref:RNA polymerase sigma factor n=1 Tax=Paenibacillus luteus TaxID=2545753 RepID=UPI0011431263|nr:RNA polymerase sigma factor [Paenibacillus luteus]